MKARDRCKISARTHRQLVFRASIMAGLRELREWKAGRRDLIIKSFMDWGEVKVIGPLKER
jgi:hypothetical protein